METPSQLDALYIVCHALGDILKFYNNKHVLLQYDLENITSEEEKEAITDRFYLCFAPAWVDIKNPTENEYMFALYMYSYALNAAIISEKASQGLYLMSEVSPRRQS